MQKLISAGWQILGLWFMPRHHLRVLVPRLGLLGTALLLSLASFVMAVLIMLPINALTGGSFVTGLIVSSVICATMVPYYTYQIGALVLELEQTRDRLYKLSVYDELTQVHNRRHFFESAGSLFSSSSYPAATVAILLIDFDRFKQINDVYGHAVGDHALVTASDLIRRHQRAGDLLARYGGEEFISLLPNTTLAQAADVAERLRSEIEATPIICNAHTLRVTVSIGVCAGDTNLPLHTLIRQADTALYEAKHAGRNCVRLH